MTTDLHELFDEAGRTPPTPGGWDPDTVVVRGRRLRRRRAAVAAVATGTTTTLVVVGALALLSRATPQTAVVSPGGSATSTESAVPATPSESPTTSTPTPIPTASACTSSDVTVSWGETGAAAGTRFEAVVLHARPGVTCTVVGTPDLVYLSAASGGAVGTALVEQPGTAPVLVDPDRPTSFTLATADVANYPSDRCKPVRVDAVRITLAEGSIVSLPLAEARDICTGDIYPYSLMPFVRGVTGQAEVPPVGAPSPTPS